MGMFMQTFHTITPEDAKKLMDEKPVTILDVREPSEFASGHIPGARNLPVGSVRREAAQEPRIKCLFAHAAAFRSTALSCALIRRSPTPDIAVKPKLRFRL